MDLLIIPVYSHILALLFQIFKYYIKIFYFVSKLGWRSATRFQTEAQLPVNLRSMNCHSTWILLHLESERQRIHIVPFRLLLSFLASSRSNKSDLMLVPASSSSVYSKSAPGIMLVVNIYLPALQLINKVKVIRWLNHLPSPSYCLSRNTLCPLPLKSRCHNLWIFPII